MFNWFSKIFKQEDVKKVFHSEFSEAFIKRVKINEGFRAEPYRDTLGKLTIGYGRLLDGKGITKEEAEYLMMNDLRKAKQDAKDLFGNFDELNEARQEVLIEMVFQLGKGGVSKFTKFRKAVANGDFVDASAEMLDSLWAKQTPNRANKLAKIMKTDKLFDVYV